MMLWLFSKRKRRRQKMQSSSYRLHVFPRGRSVSLKDDKPGKWTPF